MSTHHLPLVARTALLAAVGALALGAQTAPPTPRPATAPETPQATMLRRARLVLPPTGWRLGAFIEESGIADASSGSPAGFPERSGVQRTQLRVGLPTWHDAGYRTVIVNEVALDRYRMTYEGAPRVVVACTTNCGPLTPGVSGAPAARDYWSLSHDLQVSRALSPRWRVTGLLQQALHTSTPDAIRAESWRAQGGAILSRTYRPTLQVGAGVLAINVHPYVIPTVRVLHVGRRWRTDILVPRGETFFEVTPRLEVGAQFRFFGNRWDTNEPGALGDARTTMTFTHLGPAVNWRPTSRLAIAADAGMLLRRFRIDAATPWFATAGLPSASAPRITSGRYDPEATGYLRVRATWQLR